jgi:cytochrome c oxidase assembly protein subunit 15
LNPSNHHPWLHRYALATPVVALVTVIAGALVTSKNAGMAFRDWPTSDGQAMLTYPWLADFARDWDKFLEHGHRLAGMLIGVWSIGLAVLLAWREPRRWMKVAGAGVLLAVICQGLLGGFRVWFDQRGLAMVHGLFAACVLSLMAVVATALSTNWRRAPELFVQSEVGLVKPLALLTVALLVFQYVLGGLIRHGGQGLHEHLTVGLAAFAFIVLNAIASHRSGVRWIRRSGWLLLGVTLLQVVLGGAAWVHKYGFAPTGYVAVADSIGQVAARTAHTVVGILVLMAAVVHAARVLRVDGAAQLTSSVTLASSVAVVRGGAT